MLRVLTSSTRLVVVIILAAAGLAGCGGASHEPAPQAAFPETSSLQIEEGLDEITTELEVRVALLSELGAEGLRIDSRVVGHDVTLTGLVEDPSTADRAEKIVAGLDGVESVTNEIATVPVLDKDESRTAGDELERELADTLLVARVKLRIYAAVGLDAESIEVRAAEGTVTLGGSVDSEEDKAAAVEAAEGAEGVTQVIDVIQVSEPVIVGG